MVKDRRSFRRFYVFVIYVRRDARELVTCLVMEEWVISCDLIIKQIDPMARV